MGSMNSMVLCFTSACFCFFFAASFAIAFLPG
jgi:hypothetical protein